MTAWRGHDARNPRDRDRAHRRRRQLSQPVAGRHANCSSAAIEAASGRSGQRSPTDPIRDCCSTAALWATGPSRPSGRRTETASCSRCGPAAPTLRKRVRNLRDGANGRNIRRMTHAPGDDSHPHWSGDGRRIFFNSARATPDLKAEWSKQWIDIYSMAADGSDVRRTRIARSLHLSRAFARRPVCRASAGHVYPGLTWELDPGSEIPRCS